MHLVGCGINVRATKSCHQIARGRMAVPLLTFVDGKYALHEPTALWLAQRREPFAVLACAGKFRTGKSFLLNRLTEAPPGKGFGVGETVQACTRGIWLRKEFLPGRDGAPDVLVLDTEGIDALDAESEHDVRVFALAVLLCSAFAYNSMSHLDEAAVQTLSLMTRVAQAVGGEGRPALYWILRDFSLQLVDTKGNPMSHSDYLEQALDTASKCATREAIKAVFPARHLVTLPRPHKGDSAQRLEHKGASAINPKFEKFLDQFRTHVCTQSAPVAAAGVPMTGAVYVELARTLVARVNEDGVLPKMEDSWTLLARAQHMDATSKTCELVLDQVERQCPTASEAAVAQWVEERCRREAGATIYMAPAPDVAEVAGRLADKAMRRARELGRVQDAVALARTALDASMGAMGAVLDASSAQHLLPGPANEAVRGVYFEMALQKVCTDLWPMVVSTAVERGRHDALEEQGLEFRRLHAELEASREALAEAREREEALRDEVHHATTAPSREEVGTDTIDLKEEPPVGSCEEDAARQARVLHLETELEAVRDRADHAETRVATLEEREKELHKAFDEGIEALQKEADAQVDTLKKERDAAREQGRASLDKARALESEGEKVRALLREAQERAVDVHRTTLEELRRRDAEGRALMETQRREQSELHARCEVTAQESRGLKRRVDELLEEAEEAKRLRTAAQQAQVERARDEAEREAMRAQLASLREEREALRAANLKLESRLAVAEASSKLESFRRKLGA